MIRILKFLLRVILRLFYRVEVNGFEHYEKAGDRVLIVANHTSLLDGVLLYAWLPETPTFAINTQIASLKHFTLFLKFVDLFIMDPTNPLSVKSMIKFIKQDRKAIIFPEGRITTTGSLMKIYDGPGLIADKSQASILPIAIDGAQFSPFSYMKGRSYVRLFPKIKMTMLPPEKIHLSSDLRGHARRQAAALKMQDIMNKLVYSSYERRTTLFSALLSASNRYGKHSIIAEDISRQPLSYKQLIKKILVLARGLEKTTEKGENVGVMLPNTLAMPITFMALSYLGRIPALLNYTAGAQTIQKACETAQIKQIYSSREFIEKANLGETADVLAKQFKIIYLEDVREDLSLLDKLIGFARSYYPSLHHSSRTRNADPDAPAVILFTSGSEGTPKGVVLSHANLLSNYGQILCHIDFNPNDIIFACLPMFHSFGLNAGFITPILAGTKIFIYPTPLHYRIIPELFYELGATVLFGTNTFFQGYAHHAHPYDFNSARYIVAGAEKLREDTVKLWMEKFGIRILQGYGVTETSPVISVNTPMYHKMGSGGRPVPELEYTIRPTEGIDEGGRLCVKGPNIMLGYLHHGHGGKIEFPESPSGKGWYDTGDIARVDESDFIFILGRAKRFAKIGGEMVSLTVVEELAMHIWPNYNHAAVILADDRKGEKIILISDYQDANRKAIQEHVRSQKHSELAIPKTVLLTKEFPVLGTGKIDYPTLTKMAEEADDSGENWLSKLSHLVIKPAPNNIEELSTENDSTEKEN